MERTINGKKLSEAFEQLVKPFKASEICYKYEKYPYFPYDAYFKRLEEVIGAFNYDFLCGDSKLNIINGHPCLSKTGVLIIYDDNHNVVKKVKAGAGVEITILKETGNISNYDNEEKTLDRNVFSNVLQAIGVGRAQLKAMREENEKKRSSNSVKHRTGQIIPSSRQATIPTNAEPYSQSYHVICKKALSAMSHGYKTEVEADGKTYELIIFKEGMSAIERQMPMSDFSRQIMPGSKFFMEGYLKTYQGREQLIMTNLCH